ncbi:MAG: hypothetical protein ABSH16_00105 [Sedimentisphaerales bacterium]
MKCYRIKNWNDIYECSRNREHKELKWFACPIKLAGDGYTMIMELPDGTRRKEGAAIYGAWMACVQVAAACSPRGTFIKSDGTPHDENSLSRKTRIPAPIIKQMLTFCYGSCKWLEMIEINARAEKSPEVAGKMPDDAKKRPYITLHYTTLHNTQPGGRGGNKKSLLDLGNGKNIYYSMLGKLLKYCKKDKDQTGRIIYRSKDKDNPTAWLNEGMKTKKNSYLFVASVDEDAKPQEVKNWIDEKVWKIPVVSRSNPENQQPQIDENDDQKQARHTFTSLVEKIEVGMGKDMTSVANP